MARRPAAQQLELEVNDPEPSPPSSRIGREQSRRPTAAALDPDKAASEPARGLQRLQSKPELPRLALTFAESAALLGVSDEFFAQHVALELRFVRRGRKKLVAVRELE